MGAELTAEYDPVESDLALPKVKKADFLGKQAYLESRERGPATMLCTLALEPADGTDHGAQEGTGDGRARCMTGGEPILTQDGATITDARGRRSFVTSAGPAPSLGRYLLMAYLPPEHAQVGTRLQVDYLGARHAASVLSVGRTPPFDPEDARMKA